MAYLGNYNSPTDLMNDQTLSRDEKINMLQQWRDDKKALLRAANEGMQGGDPSDVLRKIKKALRCLQTDSND
ncbi:hypothetical protein MUY35_03445 [Aliiroseovarius sp. S1339]|uniref:hypothetical protein n=1 Tax=Aliiroseovarius sp. S1339 TaxID=2936990 RepID=UPI0020C05942|nr:hypothetical protein [Aliiroseovarius sp. S1339]MCK8462901.1 hypothetical protein [Aliiroseovarius sp. S1339]